jgi:hypothetical protein
MTFEPLAQIAVVVRTDRKRIRLEAIGVCPSISRGELPSWMLYVLTYVAPES